MSPSSVASRRPATGERPAGRIGEPEDIAQAAVWLASDLPHHVIGATSVGDGGMTLYSGLATGG